MSRMNFTHNLYCINDKGIWQGISQDLEFLGNIGLGISIQFFRHSYQNLKMVISKYIKDILDVPENVVTIVISSMNVLGVA